MPQTHPAPTEVDLLIGRIVVMESFSRRGWVGIAVPDMLGNPSLVGVFNGQELRRYVSSLIELHGDGVREVIAVYHPPSNHQIYFVPNNDAHSKGEARAIILNHMRNTAA